MSIIALSVNLSCSWCIRLLYHNNISKSSQIKKKGQRTRYKPAKDPRRTSPSALLGVNLGDLLLSFAQTRSLTLAARTCPRSQPITI